jgi:hypothetical protein
MESKKKEKLSAQQDLDARRLDPLLADVSRIIAEPGDLLYVRLPKGLSNEEKANASSYLKAFFEPYQVKLLVGSMELKFGVISPKKAKKIDEARELSYRTTRDAYYQKNKDHLKELRKKRYRTLGEKRMEEDAARKAKENK